MGQRLICTAQIRSRTCRSQTLKPLDTFGIIAAGEGEKCFAERRRDFLFRGQRQSFVATSARQRLGGQSREKGETMTEGASENYLADDRCGAMDGGWRRCRGGGGDAKARAAVRA